MAGDFSIGSEVWPGTSKLIEEMGELGQVLGKLIGTGGETNHWDGTDLRRRLVEEAADVQAAALFFTTQNLTVAEQREVGRRLATKVATFRQWQEDQVPLPWIVDHDVHACRSCGLGPSCGGPGCVNCRQTGYDQTPCRCGR